MIVIANVFPKLHTVKTWVDHFIKSAVRTSLAVNMLKGTKHLRNLYERSFIIFFDHFEGK